VQSNSEQATFGGGVHGEIEDGGSQYAIDDALDFAGGFFEDEDVVASDEGHGGRLDQVGGDGSHAEVRIDESWSVGLGRHGRECREHQRCRSDGF